MQLFSSFSMISLSLSLSLFLFLSGKKEEDKNFCRGVTGAILILLFKIKALPASLAHCDAQSEKNASSRSNKGENEFVCLLMAIDRIPCWPLIAHFH